MYKVSIVILNYNGKKWLEKFLPDVILNTTYTDSEIIIADNASTDDSVIFLKNNFPEIRIIQNRKNTGYAGGYNEALKQIDSDYYVLLNSDVEVTPYWVENVIQYMMQDKLIAACQPKILSYTNRNEFEYAGAAGGFIDKYGYPFCRGRIFNHSETDEGQYNESGEIFWASGACLFINAKLFHKVGGLDVDFFAHMEEIDICWRLKNMGYKICYCAESTVYHVGGGTLNKSNPKKTYLNFRNNRALLYKNLDIAALNKITFIRNILDKIAWLKIKIVDSKEDADAVRKAYIDYHNEIPKLEKKRLENEKMIQTISVGLPNKNGILHNSIVWNYYIKGKKKFSELYSNK